MSLVDHSPLRRPLAAKDDLRLPLLLVAVAAVGISALHSLPAIGLALAAAVALVLTRRVDRAAVLHRMAHVEGFVLVLVAFLCVTVPGAPVVVLGPLTVTDAGLTHALVLGGRINAMVLILLALLGRAAPEHLGRSLAALGAPQRFVRLMELLWRHSHTARAALHRQREAMRARGFRPGAGPHGLRSFGHLIGGALSRAMLRAERVEEAIRLRGGRSADPAPMPPMTGAARAVLVVAALAMLALVLWDRLA
ncbi:energy-coupling factor transporter transmembrane component T family protein [Neotabrizicola sp. VNH66]|uniref:energy-coupling factor transporter transmembrane component T family protein n=1 Tax=Neotabrizicola sp. VNH66 TaxID=3400918 RepID=UPI003C119705